MPTYVLKNKETEEQFEVFCQWSDLQKMLENDKNLTQVITAPKIVSGIGNLHSKVPDGFKDVLIRDADKELDHIDQTYMEFK